MRLNEAKVPSPADLHRRLTLELVRVTERGAIAAAHWRGKGDEQAADAAAVQGIAAELQTIAIDGRVVIGEGEQHECERLYIGERVGLGEGPQVDIAVDPLEGVTLCAKNQPDSMVALAMAERGGLLNVARDVYMHKIAIGAGYPSGTVHLDWTATQNVT
ncbi:MAG: glpX, partial [Devosia sp.]|nr:glpX [Devosia sp.]